MKHRIIATIVLVLFCAGCLPSHIKKEYEDKIAVLKQREQVLSKRIQDEEISDEEYLKVEEELESVKEALKKTKKEYQDLKDEAVIEGATSIENSAPTVGGVIGTFWPFGGPIIASLISAIAGGIRKRREDSLEGVA